jgi:hypothetical protein
MSNINVDHLEVRPTRPEDDSHEGLRWTVYLVNRVYDNGKCYIDGPYHEELTPYSQHATYPEAAAAMRAAKY